MTMKEFRVTGAGGGGGGGGDSHTPVESPNTLLTKTTARVLFLTSDGEVGGLADQVNKQKSVFLNNVPIMNADGSLNTAHAAIDERYGLPSQSVMGGYPSASSTFNLGSKVTTSTAVTYTTSTSSVDAVRVTVRFPALFAQQSNGDTTGTSVNFQIYTKLGAGSFSLVKDVTKTDKCISPADTDYLINRPSGAGVWSVKVVRVTADNGVTTLANDIYFQTAAEIQFAQLPYNNRAYIGMTLTAEATGATYPTVSYDMYGIKVKVPSNYNVSTRIYTGTWDGTFSGTKQVCDNPAWVLYDLLTNTSHGMGNAIAEANVDKYSFYDAAVYNDGLVPAVVNGAISGTEPRYRFNYQFMAQEDAWTMIQNMASSFASAVYTSGNSVRLVQDRPTSWSRLITNSNVVDGMFEYMSSQITTRTSAAIVYWNDPNQNWLAVPCYYEDTAGTTRYGYAVKEVVGQGVTSEGQALRLAKWHVDTSLNNLDSVIFKVGFNNAGIEPGEVVKVMDTDYAQTMLEAKVVSSTASSLTLDRAIAVTSGNTFDVVGTDGVTIYTRTITSTGTLSTINFSGAVIAVSPFDDVIITGSTSPRQFKITNVKEDSSGVWTVSAVEYDNNKFGRVDSTPTGPTPVFQVPVLIPTAVLNLAFRETATNIESVIHRSLMISWTRPVTGTVKNYILRVRRNNTSWDEYTVNTSSYELQNVLEGTYEVQVYATSTLGNTGPDTTGTYTVGATGGSASLLGAPTGLTVVGGGTTFSNVDLNFQWTNPASNSTVAATLKDFEVRYIETAGSTTVRTVYYDAVPSGSIQIASYTFSMNSADGGPRRTIQVQVRCRDSSNNLSNPVTVSFNNPAPAGLSGFNVSGGYQNAVVKFTYSTDPDIKGYLVWGSTTNGFTPSPANLLYDGGDNYFAHQQLTDSTTWYYKAAAYDTFGKDYAGTGLNLTVQSGATTSSGISVNEYQLTGVTWTPNSPSANNVAWTSCTAIQSLGTGIGSSWAVSAGSATWTTGVLYIYYVAGASTLSSTTSIATALASTNNVIMATYRGGTNLEYGNGKAYTDGSFIIAGTVGATQVVSAGLITQSAQINNALINDAHFTGLLTAAKIDTRGLTIKDASGNVILSSGVPLDWSNIGGTGLTTNNTNISNAQTTANTAVTNAATAQTTANTAVTNASTAQTTANTAVTNAATAQTAANTANTALTNIASDNILSPSEKPPVVRDYSAITAEQSGLDAQATSYSITTEKTTYDNAVSALTTYLGTLSGWNTIPGSDVVIVGTTFRSKFTDVYTAKQALLNAIVAAAKTLAATAQTQANTAVTNAATAQSTAVAAAGTATWTGVTGTGKPADNATVGATFGTDISGQITSANASTYIADLAVNTIKLANGSISDTRFFVSNTSTTLVSATAVGSSSISNVVVAEMAITTPNPAGLAGPFATYIHAQLLTNTRVNGDISWNAGLNSTLNASINVNSAPTWMVKVIRVSDGSVTASSSSLNNNGGVALGKLTLNAGMNSTLNSTIAINASGGTNLVFLAPNLLANTAYKIQIIAAGSMTVNSTDGTLISVTADQRAIYYQCLLR